MSKDRHFFYGVTLGRTELPERIPSNVPMPSWPIDIPKELTVLTPADGVKILANDARREGKYEWPAP